MRGNKFEKSHILILESEKLWVGNPELLKLYKRLSIQLLIFANYRPMSTICQHYYFTVGWEMFYKKVGRLWKLSDLWRISGSYSQEMMGLVLGHNSFSTSRICLTRFSRYSAGGNEEVNRYEIKSLSRSTAPVLRPRSGHGCRHGPRRSSRRDFLDVFLPSLSCLRGQWSTWLLDSWCFHPRRLRPLMYRWHKGSQFRLHDPPPRLYDCTVVG